jgi:hypothetical protein
MIKFIKSLFKKHSSNYYSMIVDSNEEYNIMMQENVDKKVEQSIKQEASRLFYEWINAPTIKIENKEWNQNQDDYL